MCAPPPISFWAGPRKMEKKKTSQDIQPRRTHTNFSTCVQRKYGHIFVFIKLKMKCVKLKYAFFFSVEYIIIIIIIISEKKKKRSKI